MNSHAILGNNCTRHVLEGKLHSASPRAITFLLIHGSVQLFPKLHSNSCDYLYKYAKTIETGEKLSKRFRYPDYFTYSDTCKFVVTKRVCMDSRGSTVHALYTMSQYNNYSTIACSMMVRCWYAVLQLCVFELQLCSFLLFCGSGFAIKWAHPLTFHNTNLTTTVHLKAR